MGKGIVSSGAGGDVEGVKGAHARWARSVDRWAAPVRAAPGPSEPAPRRHEGARAYISPRTDRDICHLLPCREEQIL